MVALKIAGLLGSILIWSQVLMPTVLAVAFPVERFATNERGDGPPVLTVGDAPLVYGEHGTPRVIANWTAQRQFHDTRRIDIYAGTLLGPSVCTLHIPDPPREFLNRKGSVQPGEGYSLDRWTDKKLAQCELDPGHYAMVTEYRVKVLGGLYTVRFPLPSNVFEILPPPR